MTENKLFIEANKLTPVEQIGGLYIKRDDLFAPFSKTGVNGGKLRQCVYLINEIKDNYDGVITYCSLESPQAPITSAVANYYNLDTTIVYGGSRLENFDRGMPGLARSYGGNLIYGAKTGRHNVLKAYCNKVASIENKFIVQYGINIDDFGTQLIESVADQVANIPDRLDNLVMVCGSGISCSSVMVGLNKYNKLVNNIYLIGTGPNRKNKIDKILEDYNASRDYNIIDVNNNGTLYDKRLELNYYGIELHPRYEAKAMNWLINNPLEGDTLFWIVGAEPAYN